jgi:hypothetical protein
MMGGGTFDELGISVDEAWESFEWVRCATRQSHQNGRPGHEMPPLSYPLKTPKNSIFTLLKMKPPRDPQVDFIRANAAARLLWCN